MHLLWNQQKHEILLKLWTERSRCDQSNFSLDEAPAVRASPISLYTSPFSRSLRGTAIFQITKYPSYKFLSKSGNGCWKQDDQGQIFLRGTELVNRCQIWQSWHNWGGESTKRPVEASYRPGAVKNAFISHQNCWYFSRLLHQFVQQICPISLTRDHLSLHTDSNILCSLNHNTQEFISQPVSFLIVSRKAISGPR